MFVDFCHMRARVRGEKNPSPPLSVDVFQIRPTRASDKVDKCRGLADTMTLSKTAREAMRQVLRELLAEALHEFRDDAEDLARMGHDTLKFILAGYIARRHAEMLGVVDGTGTEP